MLRLRRDPVSENDCARLAHMKALAPADRRALRARAHHLQPVVSVGTHGLTPAVLHEIDVNLMAHELIKLRVHSDDRDERGQLLARICEELDAAPVQHLGKVLVIYRERSHEEDETPPPKPRKSATAATRRAPRDAARAVAHEVGEVSPDASRTRRLPRPNAPRGAHPPARRRRRG